MLWAFPELYGVKEEVRMMFRASHIYVLLASLINFMAANFRYVRASLRLELVFSISSFFIILASVALMGAFVYEPPIYAIDRPITFWAIIMLFSGVLLQTVACFFEFKRP